MQECLVLDDADAALSSLTPLGRDVIGPAAAALRAAVIAFVTRRGWQVVAHGSFASWASDLVPTDPRPWLCLDPLLMAARGDGAPMQLRFSRRLDPSQGFVVSGEVPDEAHGLSGSGLIDDAASSGTTLSRVIDALAHVGTGVGTVALCASSRTARERLCARYHLRWKSYLPGDWRVIHLRDGFPLLPHAGRPTGLEPIGTSTRAVAQRSSVLTQPGSLWQVLAMDRVVSAAIAEAGDVALRSFGAALGRAPVVGDLPLLGDEVSAPAPLSGTLEKSTELSHALRAVLE
jgi:hypothetical protein